MRRRPALLLAVALACCCVSSARATGHLDLLWNAPLGDGGTRAKFDACDANTGSDVLVATFAPPETLHTFVAEEAWIDVTFCGPIPDWWRMVAPNDCRSIALSATLTPDPAWTSVTDYWQGEVSPDAQRWFGVAMQIVFDRFDIAEVRLHVAASIPDEFGRDIVPERDYLGFAVRLAHLRTVGDGECIGCSARASLQLSRLELYSAERPFLEELLPEAGGATVGWQSDGTQRLLCTTPARVMTWGQIKAMYR